jgi:NhaP-type Na+/H+ or K+/H+ antiporter
VAGTSPPATSEDLLDELHLGYAWVGSLAVALAAMSTKVRDLTFSEPLLALLLEVLAGPEILGLIHVPEDGRSQLVTEVARVLPAVSLMGVGLRSAARGLGECSALLRGW